jgi:hypothetical protein
MAFDSHPLPHVGLADLNGSVKLTYAEGSFDIRFDWAAIAKLQAVHGENFLDRVNEALGKKEIPAVCELLSITTGLNRDEIMKASPPIIASVEALSLSWQVAWRGSAEQGSLGTDDTEDEEEDGKKSRSRLTLWQRLGNWLCNLG